MRVNHIHERIRRLVTLHRTIMRQFVVFVGAGLATAVVHGGIYVACIEFAHLPYYVANPCGFVPALGLNFVLHERYTFGIRTHRVRRFLLFTGKRLLFLVPHNLALVGFIHYLGFNPYAGQVLVVAIFGAVTFYILRRWIFAA